MQDYDLSPYILCVLAPIVLIACLRVNKRLIRKLANQLTILGTILGSLPSFFNADLATFSGFIGLGTKKPGSFGLVAI